MGERRAAQRRLVFLQQSRIFFYFAPVQPHNGVQVLELPLAPLVQRAVHHGVVVPTVDKQHLVPQCLRLSLVEEPQRAGQRFGVEKVVAHADHHVHMAALHQLLPDVPVLAGAVCGGGGHDKTSPASLIQIGIKIGDPEIVCIPHLFGLVDGGQTERQASRVLGGFGIDLVHVERRIRHHIVTAAVQIVGVVVKGISLIAGFDDAVEPVDRHVHQAELGVVLHLLLAVEGHRGVGLHASGVDEVTGLDKHAATAAGGVKEYAAVGLQNVDNHLDQRLRRKKHPVVLCNVFGKFVEEVFIDAPDHVAAHLVQGAVVENAQQLRQKLVGENGVILGQDARQLFRLGLHQLHGVVDYLAQAVHGVAALVDQLCRGDIGGEIDQIFVLGFSWQKQGTFGDKIAGLHR